MGAGQPQNARYCSPSERPRHTVLTNGTQKQMQRVSVTLVERIKRNNDTHILIMAILRLSARVMVMVCLPPGVNGANHRCMSSLINENKIVFKVMLNGTIRNDDLQHNTALQCWNNVVAIRNNVATMLQRCVLSNFKQWKLQPT